MQKTLAITLCVVGAVILAIFSINAGDWYWLFLIAAALLGVAAGIIKNLPNRQS
jgi:hypothetical protein